MAFVQAISGRGGWPLNVFLTPNLEPIYGGTYFAGPDVESVGRPEFIQILERIRGVWKNDPERAKASAQRIIAQLREFVRP
jgi:uncharacterized protein YyaL (SSP411 family)